MIFIENEFLEAPILITKITAAAGLYCTPDDNCRAGVKVAVGRKEFWPVKKDVKVRMYKAL